MNIETIAVIADITIAAVLTGLLVLVCWCIARGVALVCRWMH